MNDEVKHFEATSSYTFAENSLKFSNIIGINYRHDFPNINPTIQTCIQSAIACLSPQTRSRCKHPLNRQNLIIAQKVFSITNRNGGHLFENSHSHSPRGVDLSKWGRRKLYSSTRLNELGNSKFSPLDTWIISCTTRARVCRDLLDVQLCVRELITAAVCN